MTEAGSVADLIESYRDVPGGLMPLLHAVQDRLGYIPAETVTQMATAFHLSRAEVHGVISFYHDFRTAPVGRHIVQICRAEACQSVGSRQLESHAKAVLGLDYGETSADGALTLQPVYCLGNCACGPSVRVDDDIYARVDAQSFDELVTSLSGVDSQ